MKLVALLFVLALAVSTCDAICITHVKVNAVTGDMRQSQSKVGHTLTFVLQDGRIFSADLQGMKARGQPYTANLDMFVDFKTSELECIRRIDIENVHLYTTSRNAWFISSIIVSTSNDGLVYEDLTRDVNFNRWLDLNGDYPYDAQDHILRMRNRHVVDCGYGITACECRPSADECEFHLEIDEIRTFTSYHILPSGQAITVRGTHGAIFNIDDDGIPQPVRNNRICSDNPNCTDPHFVDGKTYRLAIAVNGQIPGPDLIVHEDQTVVVNVKNNLTTEGISVHWHGMEQRGTPWMDGVGQVSQCQIGPSSKFTYIFKAFPFGTFWYHSHTGGQRTDGFFGALIVRESEQRMNSVREALRSYCVEEFQDNPFEHSISLLDWQEQASIDLFTQISSRLGFYPGVPLGEVPTQADARYKSTSSYENGRIGQVPYFSGLINGRGRHEDVPYVKTQLSVFNVEQGSRYRFRLIGAQSMYAYKFSIDGHNLTVVATDGHWIEPVVVDFIIIHSGERYDFFLDAQQGDDGLDNYWMRAETLEVFSDFESLPPYQSQGHSAEAILHYTQPDDMGVPSTEYEAIKDSSPKHECIESSHCTVLNCPFENFHLSYYIHCINVNKLSLLLPTPLEELPNADPDPDCQDCTHFLNFDFDGVTHTSAINGRNFVLPAHPPQTQHDDFRQNDVICDLDSECNPSEIHCICVNVRTLPYNQTIQLVFSILGDHDNTHPIHLHGHSFQVVHIGYPEYNESTGAILEHNTDIQCDDRNCTLEDCVPERCTRPRWRNRPTFEINETTIRKDTVIIPAGGYVVVNFISDNPGYWIVHCHIMVHQLEGMALIFNEAPDGHNPPPDGLNQCGDFEWDTDAFEEKLNSLPPKPYYG